MCKENDNLETVYKSFEANPDFIRKSLTTFHTNTERAYAAFKSIVDDHEDMGKAAIIIMARNQATHLMEIAKSDDKNALNKVVSILSPMYTMLYDRYTEDSINELVNSLDGK